MMAETTTKMSKEEKKWRAESDAHTLTEAETIKKDSDRFILAQKAAQKMAKEQMDKAKAMKKIASAKMQYDKSPKP